VPPLSDKLSAQKPLNQQEVDIVYRWLQVRKRSTSVLVGLVLTLTTDTF
jgi:hypothetical protein